MESTINSVLITQQWILISITFVYVIATILISIFNFRSAKATREQVQESKRQYSETKRLSMQPYFNITIDQLDPNNSSSMQLKLTEGTSFLIEAVRFDITNIGLGAAKEIQFCLSTIPEHPEIIWKTLGKTALLSGEKLQTRISFLAGKDLVNRSFSKVAFLQIRFEDLLDNKYLVSITLNFVGSDYSFKIQKYDIQQGLITNTEKKHA